MARQPKPLRDKAREIAGRDDPTLVADIAIALQEAEQRVIDAEELLRDWVDCAEYDAMMSGPVFKGWNRSALDRCLRATLAALTKDDANA